MSILLGSNFQWVIVSVILLGMASGLIGCLSYWKRQSLMSDAISHAALPGVVIAYLLLGEKNLLAMMLGAVATALLGAFFIHVIQSSTRIKQDTAMGFILAVFFGGGIMLLTIANRGGGNQAGLDNFIFGQAASMVRGDMYLMSALALIAILVVTGGFKEWKLLLFDPGFAKGIGLPVKRLNAIYLMVLVVTIVAGIQAVGVILMAALLIIPPVSARYWTESFKWMMVLSALIGAAAGAAGTIVSALGSGWPTGPFIVVASSICFLFSFLFGTKKGLATEFALQRRQRKAVLSAPVRTASARTEGAEQ